MQIRINSVYPISHAYLIHFSMKFNLTLASHTKTCLEHNLKDYDFLFLTFDYQKKNRRKEQNRDE